MVQLSLLNDESWGRALAYREGPPRSIELVHVHKHRPWGVWHMAGHAVQERKCIFWLQRSSSSPVQAHEEAFICPYRALRAAQVVKVREEAIEQPQRQGVLRA